MTLDELKSKLPSALQPWVDQYGPVVLAWSAAELKAWIESLVAGDVAAAYAKVLGGLSDRTLMDEWVKISADWRRANADNAARIALQKAAAVELLKIVLAIALASVGL